MYLTSYWRCSLVFYALLNENTYHSFHVIRKHNFNIYSGAFFVWLTTHCPTHVYSKVIEKALISINMVFYRSLKYAQLGTSSSLLQKGLLEFNINVLIVFK